MFARTANVRFRQADAEDTALLVLGAGPDATLTIETSNAMSSFPGTIEIHGTAGWLRAEGTFDDGATILTHAGDRHTFPDITTAEVYERALLDFLGAVRGLPAIGATPRQAADTVAIVEAAVQGIGRRPGAMNLASPIIDSHVHVWRSGHPGGAALWREPYPVRTAVGDARCRGRARGGPGDPEPGGMGQQLRHRGRGAVPRASVRLRAL